MTDTLEARVKEQTIAAMKARYSERTTTLRLITTALKNKVIEKRTAADATLSQAEAQQVLAAEKYPSIHPSLRRQKSQNSQRCYRLARTRLAY